MKNMKKILALVLAMLFIVASVAALADGNKITINRASGDEYKEETTYTYYQILKAEIGTPATVTASTGASTGGTAAYYMDDDDLNAALATAGAATIFDIETVANTNPVRKNYILKDNKTISDILPVVTAAGVLAKATATGTFTRAANADTAVSPNLDPGYYVIKSSLGSVIAVQTLSDVTINEKNTYPTITKDVDDTIFEYGQEATYTLTITIPANPADKDLIVYDRMHEGLTATGTITVTGTKEGAGFGPLSWAADSYTADADQLEGYNYYQTTIPKASVLANAGQTITLTYKAIVNEKALVYTDVPNTVRLEYDDHSFATPEDTEKVKSLAFKIKKVDGSNTSTLLTDAEFSLWTAETDGTQIPLIQVTAGQKYRVATPAEAAVDGFTSAVITGGNPQIDGLDDTTYWIQEDKAPSGGYNKLTGRVSVTPDTTAVIDRQIENNQGSTLPSTGGIGTTLLYVGGSILVILAAVLLITKRRMKAED